jgi:hypothetical protein
VPTTNAANASVASARVPGDHGLRARDAVPEVLAAVFQVVFLRVTLDTLGNVP